MYSRHLPYLSQCDGGRRFSKPSDAGACVLGPIIVLLRASEVCRNVEILVVHTSTVVFQGNKLKQGTSVQHLALISWHGGVQAGLERVALSAFPVHPSGVASAAQIDSSSEDTSSLSDETDVEVIGTILRSCSLQTFNPPRSLASQTSRSRSVQQWLQGDWELERLRPGEGRGAGCCSLHSGCEKGLGL